MTLDAMNTLLTVTDLEASKHYNGHEIIPDPNAHIPDRDRNVRLGWMWIVMWPGGLKSVAI